MIFLFIVSHKTWDCICHLHVLWISAYSHLLWIPKGLLAMKIIAFLKVTPHRLADRYQIFAETSCLLLLHNSSCPQHWMGWDNSVGIATRYGLASPIESRWGRDFPLPSRPTLGLTQPPIQWVPGLCWGVERPRRGVDRPPHLALRLKK